MRVKGQEGGGAATRLHGVVFLEHRLGGARVSVFDQAGTCRETVADAAGRYAVDVSGLRAPLLVSAVASDAPPTGVRPVWWRSVTALCAHLRGGQDNVANVNALTDRIVSDIALSLREEEPALVGPHALVERGHTRGIEVASIAQATADVRALLGDAPGHVGLPTAWFDPLTAPMEGQFSGMDELLALLIHQRGLDNPSGRPGTCLLLDADYRFVGRFDAHSRVEALDFMSARRAWREQRDPARRRIVVVGDSTASTYELARYPRMGWGQVLREQFRHDARLTVINAAKSGRSSRAFLEQGLLARAAGFLREGDYLFIQFGDNDASCNLARPVRGAADVACLCTWPDDAEGVPQHPADQPQSAFRHVLQSYLTAARERGAIPVLLTPAARLLDAHRQVGVPVVPNHVTRHAADTDYRFVGDYAQTVRNLAAAEGVPLVDMESLTIAFPNANQDVWRDYWLAVDPAAHPWYATQGSGTLEHPDPLHFQEAGARLLAGMVSGRLRSLGDPRLAPLVAMMV